MHQTPLHPAHRAAGAKLVDFAGWDMPIQYTSIIEEHMAVRTAAGLFDISHMGRLSFGGSEALALIQQVFTNNAATMKDGQARYGLICNESGGILDDVLVYRWPYGWAMVVNASNRTKILDWLGRHKGALQVEIQDQTPSTCMVAIQGPRAVDMCRGLTDFEPSELRYYFAMATRYKGRQCVISRTGYTGEDGLEVMLSAAHAAELWEDLLRRGARPAGLGARDTLRLEAAMPLYGHDLNEEIDPFQAGLAWAVKMDKGDFIGRAALARRQQDTSLPVRVGLELEGKRIAREGATVLQGGQEAGQVSSGTFSPTLQKAIAMAYVNRSLAAPGTSCAVDIRGQATPARVVELPFYRRAR